MAINPTRHAALLDSLLSKLVQDASSRTEAPAGAASTTSIPQSKIYDVLIVGGGPAGLGAAAAVARQLQTAVLFDSGVHRDGRAARMHGVPGFDCVDPAAFRTRAKSDILAGYDAVEFRKATVAEIEMLDSGAFRATDRQGRACEGRKVVLATGVRDMYPDIEGYEECWGRGIFHCLHFQGYEERGGDSAGLLAADNLSNVQLVSHMGNMALRLAKSLTIYTNGDEVVQNDIQANARITDFKTRVKLEKRRIKSLRLASGSSPGIFITLEDGSEVKESFLTHLPKAEINGPFASQLGLETDEQGAIQVSAPFNETSVPGVFAAGDIAGRMRTVPNAIYGGSVAGRGSVLQLQGEDAQLGFM